MVGEGALAARPYDNFAVDFSNDKIVLYMRAAQGENKVAEMDVQDIIVPVGIWKAISCIGTVRGMNGPVDEIWNIYLT